MTSCAGLLRLFGAAGACGQEVTFVVHDDGGVGLDGLRVVFDDERVVSDAGVALVATLAQRLGIEALAQQLVRLRRDRPGAANAGRKVIALVYAMALGADSIDDTDVLRAGRTRRLLGGWIPAPSTLGTFLRAFTFGHVRQLDALLGRALERAWQAGAGPGDGRLVIDVDSFLGEVCGRLKQGAAHGYTKLLGYHPILATRADTRETLHIRLRKGSANTQKGIVRFTDELIARVTRAGATGVKLLRADSGFWNTKVFERLERAGWQYSIGVRMIKTIAAAVAAIPDDAWQTIDYPEDGEAQIAETVYGRAQVDRQTHAPARRAGRAVARLAALLLPHQPRRGPRAGRGRAPRPRRRRAGHRRPQRPGAGALPLGRLQRQRRLDRARRARAQPAALDAAARTPGHNRARRAHPAPPAAPAPRPPDPPRRQLDAAPPGPLALARRLHPRAQPHPRAPRPDLTAGAPADHESSSPARQGTSPAARQHPNNASAEAPASAQHLRSQLSTTRARPISQSARFHPAQPALSVDPG